MRRASIRLAPRNAHDAATSCAFSFGYNFLMDFFFAEDDLQRLAPEETRVQSLDVQPYPDGQRLRVNIQMTPFQQRPHLEIRIVDGNGDEVATASIVEPMSWKLELTMHLRGASANPFTIAARLFYPQGPEAEPLSRSFEVVPQT